MFIFQICAEYYGNLIPIFAITGCCQGIEFQLESDAVSFGTVFQRCQATRRLIMSNTGDVGSRYVLFYCFRYYEH